MDNYSLVVNTEVFEENYLPKRVVGREAEIDLVVRCLKPAAQRKRPIHVWLYGRAGTGKTAVARHVLRQLDSEGGVRTAYVSCWRSGTLYKVADALVEGFRILMAEQQNTGFKLERIRRHMGGTPLVVVLDEIDAVPPKDRNDIIRGLCNLGKVGLVCVSRGLQGFYSMDSSLRSRLAPQIVEFGAYPVPVLEQIVADRAAEGLAEGGWTHGPIHRIAQVSRGDARQAIQMLPRAAELAEEERNPVIRGIHVSLVRQEADSPPADVVLSSLTEDHRMLYTLVLERRSVTSGDLYQLYRAGCAAAERKPVAVRTFSNYVNQLARSGLITSERARMKGKVRLFKPA